MFATRLTRLWYIHLVGGDDYHAAAQENTIRDIELAAPRGLIVDSQERALKVILTNP